VVPLPSIQTDEPEAANAIPKVVDGIVTARDGVGKWQSHAVKFAVRNAHAPDEVVDVIDVFLVGLGCKDNEGSQAPPHSSIQSL
jgi:hypothetical protein